MDDTTPPSDRTGEQGHRIISFEFLLESRVDLRPGCVPVVWAYDVTEIELLRWLFATERDQSLVL